MTVIKKIISVLVAGLLPLVCWASLPSADKSRTETEGMEVMEGFARALEKIAHVHTKPHIAPKPEKPQSVPKSSSKPQVPAKQEKPQNAPQIAPKPKTREAQLEALVHAKINEVRKKYTLGVLQWNDTLASIARLHSQDMAKRHYFSHDTLPDPKNADIRKRNPPAGFAWRYEAGGFHEEIETKRTTQTFPDGSTQTDIVYGTGAENIFQAMFGGGSPALSSIAEEVVDGWMKSKGHKKNILTPHWIREGIGVAIDWSQGYEDIYVTQDFC